MFAAAALVSAAAVQSKPFSHRIHLKLKPDCIACHRGAAASSAPSDNLLPKPEACLPCHKDVAIKQPSPTLVAKFSHERHLKMGNIAPVIAAAIDSKSYLSPAGDLRRHLDTKNACVACHRGLEESDSVTKAAFPQMADCLVCHNKIDPPFSCTQCHASEVNLKPANHTPDFVDAHSSKTAKLDKTTCAVCHGRRFTCLGCH